MKIERGRMTVEDTMDKLVERDNGITCGCDKPILRMTVHMDGTEFSQTNYACTCGNQISVVVKRSEEEKFYWK